MESRTSASRTSASKSSVSKSSNSTSKTYFSDDAANKIHKYLYYSNYEFSPDIDYPEIYMVNLFCLYKISEILKYKIDKYTKRNSSGISYSKKRGVYNIPVTRKNNNLEKTELIKSMHKIIKTINELVKNPNMSNEVSTAEGLTANIKLFLINPKLFNQKVFGKIDFNLVYNPENTNIPPDISPSKKREFKDIIIEDEAFQFDIIENIGKQIKEERLREERLKDDRRSLNRLKTTLNKTNAKSISSKQKNKENVKLLEEDLIKRFKRLRGTIMTEAELRERFEKLKSKSKSK